MPFLNSIIQGLNENWKAYLPGARFFGIAETIIDLKEDNRVKRYPAIIDEYGEAKEIIPDDDYDLAIYHRLESIVNSYSDKEAVRKESEVANMAVICFGNRTKIQKPVYWIENLLKDSLPAQSKVESIQHSVYKVGNSSFDKLTLLSREYSADIELRYPHLIGFEMKYRIESTYKKGCFIHTLNK